MRNGYFYCRVQFAIAKIYKRRTAKGGVGFGCVGLVWVLKKLSILTLIASRNTCKNSIHPPNKKNVLELQELTIPFSSRWVGTIENPDIAVLLYKKSPSPWGEY